MFRAFPMRESSKLLNNTHKRFSLVLFYKNVYTEMMTTFLFTDVSKQCFLVGEKPLASPVQIPTVLSERDKLVPALSWQRKELSFDSSRQG